MTVYSGMNLYPATKPPSCHDPLSRDEPPSRDQPLSRDVPPSAGVTTIQPKPTYRGTPFTPRMTIPPAATVPIGLDNYPSGPWHATLVARAVSQG